MRLWDVRHASDDPLNGTILAQGVDDVATFALGDIYKGEMPIILCVELHRALRALSCSPPLTSCLCSGEKSGKVTMFNHLPRT